MLDKLLKSPALAFFLRAAAKEPALVIENLWDASKAALLYCLAKSTKKNLLVLSSGSEDRLQEDLKFFALPNVLDFPSWETLPGEEIAPSPDIVGKRLEILKLLAQEKGLKVVLCPLQALLQKLPAPKTLSPLCHTFCKGQEIAFDALLSLLSTLGYRRTPVVADKGEFAVRGGIVDLFPLSSPDPYRLEFFGDVIDEMRRFDPVSQKSISKVESIFLSPAN